MREALLEALKRLQKGDENAPEDILNLLWPQVDDPRHPQTGKENEH